MIIRVAEARDVPEIVDLLVRVFPHCGRSRRHWDWSHSDDAGIAFVAEQDGHIIAHYSFGYRGFEWRGHKYRAGFAQQAAVHPAHRNLRTIVELIQFAEQTVATRCDFVFAFPNRNMAPVKERILGWTKALTFPSWRLSTSDLAQRSSELTNTAGAEGYSIQRLTTFSDLDCSRLVTGDSETLTPIRDADWFEWRYISHPLNHYATFGVFTDERCEGLVILKAYYEGEESRGYVLELHSGDNQSLKLWLLSAAADYFEFMGVGQIFAWNQDNPNRSLYESLGFAQSGFTSTMFAKPLTEDARDAVAAEWTFDMGVSDVF